MVAVFLFLGCGKGFKTQQDPFLKKAVEIEEQKQKENKEQVFSEDRDFSKEVESGEVAREEKWTQELPQKYDDVGDFYRVKEIPGLNENEELDSIQDVNPETKKVTTTLKLVRGALKLSQVKHQFSEDRTELEVTGDVTFKDQKPLSFTLKGKMTDSDIALSVVDTKSPLKDLFKAKAVCLKDVTVSGSEDSQITSDDCDKLTIDFYYKHENTFYTDQLISKAFIWSEIKNPYEEIITPDEFYQAIPDDQLTDYEKKQKKGKSDRAKDEEDVIAVKEKELPSYFTTPNIEDVSVLYPEVKKIVEDSKNKTFKPKKKLKKLPVLKGEEVIPEDDKIGPPPAMDEGADPKKTPQKDDKKPVTPPPAKEEPKKPTTPPVKEEPKKPVTPPVKEEPKKPVTPPAGKEDPKKPVTPAPTTPANPARPPKVDKPTEPVVGDDDNRPLDQAWGKPHTGQVVGGKRLYLTNATSLLEVFQKMGPNLGFSIWNPKKLRHYGTYDIVDMIVNIGEWLRENVPGFELKVNDISAKSGGQIGHSSHKTGMDVDLAYITKSTKMTFMDVDRVKGSYTHPEFDGANQWKLIKATFEMSPVEVIYVNRKIKNEMCRQALIAGDLKSNTDVKSEAASILTRLVVIDSNHGDHWHVRMDCSYLSKVLKVQRKCIPHPQAFVGPECQKVSLK